MKATTAILELGASSNVPAIDRFHAGIWVAGDCDDEDQLWSFIRAVWIVVSRALRRKAPGPIWEYDWAWGAAGISIKRTSIHDLEDACRAYNVKLDMIFLANHVRSEVPVTGATLITTSGSKSGGPGSRVELLVSIRGVSRAHVAAVSRHVVAKIEDSQRIFVALGNSNPTVSSEDLGVTTTLSMGDVFDLDPGSQTYALEATGVGTASGWVVLPDLLNRLSLRGASISIAAIASEKGAVNLAINQFGGSSSGSSAAALKGLAWLKDRWRDQTATFVLAIVAGVLIAGILTVLKILFS